MLRRRVERSWGPPVSSGSIRSSRVSNSAGDSTFTRAAANSMASGSPSRRRQIVVTAAALSLVNANEGAAARSTKRRTAGTLEILVGSGAAASSGNASGATTNSRSSCRRSGEREVARTVRAGHSARTSATHSAAPGRCSRLSSTSSMRREWSAPRTTSSGDCWPVVWRPKTVATSEATSAGSLTAARGTNATSPANSSVVGARHSKGQAGLADATGTGERQQPVLPGMQERDDGPHVLFTADERRSLSR